jgi:hypothetical protein
VRRVHINPTCSALFTPGEATIRFSQFREGVRHEVVVHLDPENSWFASSLAAQAVAAMKWVLLVKKKAVEQESERLNRIATQCARGSHE